MLRITKLEIEGIGPFAKAEFQFPEKVLPDKAEIHILTGKNGTGKTTALMMLASTFEPVEQIHVRARSYHASKFKVCFSDGSFLVNGSASTQDIYSDELRLYTRTLAKETRFAQLSFAMFAYSGHRTISAQQSRSVKDIVTQPLEGALTFDPTNTSDLLQWVVNQYAREAIALKQKNEKAAASHASAVEQLERIISEITGEEIAFYLAGDSFEVLLEKNGIELDFDVLPDGVKSIISWIGDLLMRLDRQPWIDNTPILQRNFILFLDEIDVHLHPAWQRKILPVVQSLFPNAQIFVTTHSPFVVGSCDGAWVHNLELQGTDSVPNPPVLSENSKSYQLILDEIFGVKEQFGLEVEEKLRRFRTLIQPIYANNASAEDEAAFKKVVAELYQEPGIELQQIIGAELRQLLRLTKKDYLNAAL